MPTSDRHSNYFLPALWCILLMSKCDSLIVITDSSLLLYLISYWCLIRNYLNYLCAISFNSLLDYFSLFLGTSHSVCKYVDQKDGILIIRTQNNIKKNVSDTILSEIHQSHFLQYLLEGLGILVPFHRWYSCGCFTLLEFHGGFWYCAAYTYTYIWRRGCYSVRWAFNQMPH